MPRKAAEVTETELRILDVLWERGPTIVRDMGVGHDQAIIAHPGHSEIDRAPIERGVLPNRGSGADLQARRLRVVLQVLRIGAEHGALVDMSVGTDRRIALERRDR